MRMLHVHQRCDEMLMFSVVATALLMSMALLPAYGAVTAPKTESVDSRSDRRPNEAVVQACAGQTWGHETVHCLLAIAHDSGREMPRHIRIVVASEPDSTRPNIFHAVGGM